MTNTVKLYVLKSILTDNAEYVKGSGQSVYKYYIMDYEEYPEGWDCIFSEKSWDECTTNDKQTRSANFKEALADELTLK